MTRQQMFSKVAKHLLKQNKVCKKRVGDCLYRGPKGMKCAIGALIPNKLYQKEFEDIGDLETIIDHIPTIHKLFGGRKHLKFLQDLQEIHDDFLPEDWPKKLKEFATRRRLSIHGLGLTKG